MDQWKLTLKEAVAAAGVELIELKIHQFEPQGMTAFCLLSESHLAVHTWPERDYVGIDLFTCGDVAFPELAIERLKESLLPSRTDIKVVPRGREFNGPGSDECETSANRCEPEALAKIMDTWDDVSG